MTGRTLALMALTLVADVERLKTAGLPSGHEFRRGTLTR
jgi:hypothetical protein